MNNIATMSSSIITSIVWVLKTKRNPASIEFTFMRRRPADASGGIGLTRNSAPTVGMNTTKTAAYVQPGPTRPMSSPPMAGPMSMEAWRAAWFIVMAFIMWVRGTRRGSIAIRAGPSNVFTAEVTSVVA